jgi:hypothetical protein
MKKIIFLLTMVISSVNAETVYKCGNSYTAEPCSTSPTLLFVQNQTLAEKLKSKKGRSISEATWESDKRIRYDRYMAHRALVLQETLIAAHVKLANATQGIANAERTKAAIKMKRTMLYDNGIVNPNKKEIRNFYNRIAYDALMR